MATCKEYFFPESEAGGFSRLDGTVEFYGRISALIRPSMTVLDFGAGRGQALQDDTVVYRRNLQSLRGKCRRLIGVDIDEVISRNPGLDEYHVIVPNGAIPLADDSVDMIVSDHTFEHINNPDIVISELNRILRPGGWLCARTPNRWGYIGLATNIIPNRWHEPFLRYLQPTRKQVDVFPTAYKLNSLRALSYYFSTDLWDHYIYGYFSEPAYFGESKIFWSIMLLLYRLTPSRCAPTWMVFLRKRT